MNKYCIVEVKSHRKNKVEAFKYFVEYSQFVYFLKTVVFVDKRVISFHVEIYEV